MDSVRAADGGCVLELDGAAFEHCQKSRQALAQQHRRFFHLQGLRGINDVVRREPVVQPSRLLRRGPSAFKLSQRRRS